MLYREIIAVCSHIHTKHINTLCGQNVEMLNGVKNKGQCGRSLLVRAIRVHAWTDPKDSKRLRFPDLKTVGK
jgi:hypothetical protein